MRLSFYKSISTVTLQSFSCMCPVSGDDFQFLQEHLNSNFTKFQLYVPSIWLWLPDKFMEHFIKF